MAVLIRLFRGAIREGGHERLHAVLQDQVLPRLTGNAAVSSATLAFSLESSPDEYLLESHWRGLPDLIRFAGDEWSVPTVDPAEDDLLISVSAHHYATGEPPSPQPIGPRPVPAVVHLDDVEIDGSRLLLMWYGSAVHLPPREMAAMLALASDPGAPMPSVELARRIWPGSAMVTAYDVRRVIHELRAILRRNGMPVDIRNVHGIGYGLELGSRR